MKRAEKVKILMVEDRKERDAIIDSLSEKDAKALLKDMVSTVLRMVKKEVEAD